MTCCNGEASVWRIRGNNREDRDARNSGINVDYQNKRTIIWWEINTVQTVVPDGASSFKQWMDLDACLAVFRGIHPGLSCAALCFIWSAAVDTPTPAGSRGSAKCVPTPVCRLVFTVQLEWFFFFFPPPAAPCHAKIRSRAPSAGQMGICLMPRKWLFKSTFNKRNCFRHHQLVLENRCCHLFLFPLAVLPLMR